MTTAYNRTAAVNGEQAQAQESNESGRQAARAALALPVPAAGQALALDMAQGSALQFAFDPGEATLSREGNDLVFTLDNGGSVKIADFFVVEEGGELPALILPDGEEVPAELAFADSGLDLSTAAGPAAASPQGSGGSYSDDPGSLTNGLDRLGDQGTHYWGYSREVSEEVQGLEFPAGRWSLKGVSDLGGLIGLVGAVYEDGLPYQHEGDRATFVPGQLTFNFIPEGTTVVDGIHLSGFPAGTVLYFGDPNDPNTVKVTVSGPGQVFDLSEQDFADGLYFVPPKNSDDDFTLNISVDVRAESSGHTDTVHGTATVIVDAVADKPELGEDLSAVADSSGHVSDKTSSDEKYEDGFNKTESTVSTSENGGGATVTVTVTAVFDDYLDGSEKHYLLIETSDKLALDPDSLPSGYTYTGTIVIDGVEYHQIEVDNSVIEAGNGSVSLPVDFTTTGSAAEKDGKDESFELKVGAYAEEDVDPNGEIDLNNNTAHIVTEDGKDVSTSVDVVNSTLNVSAGWASEGNNSSKHVSGGYTPGYDNMDAGDGVAADSTGANGAPIHIGLDQSGREGSAEFITSVQLTFDEGRGDLCINGTPVADGMQVPGANGVTYSVSVDPDTGTVTITVNGGQVDNLNDLNLTFRPDPTGDHRYDDTDVNMDYTVNVSNEAGAKGVYQGNTEIVIDAVADKPVNVGGAGVDYGDSAAAAPGQSVELSFKATFPDTDGSETHTVFIRVDGNKGSASHEYGDSVISGERIAEINGIAGSNVLASGGDYLELTIPPLTDFDENGSYTFEDLGITVTYNSSDGSYTISGVEVTLPGRDTLTDGKSSNGELNGKGDTSMGFDSVAWAHENADKAGSDAANNEHDLGNNDAFTKGSNTVHIAGVGANDKNFTTGGGVAFENDQPHNNRPDAGDESGNNTREDGGVELSITWNFADSNEYVSEIMISVPKDAYGNPVGYIVYNGVTYEAQLVDGQYVITLPVDAGESKTGLGEVIFVPSGHSSGEVNLGVTAVVNDSRSTDSIEVKADDITVAVDAVANRSGEVESEAHYTEGNSAVATGDDVQVKIGTTFADNDGSERHYVLVEQQPHWTGNYSVEYYDLDGDGVTEAYFKVEVPSSQADFSAEDWAALCENGTVTVDYNGTTVTVSIPQNPDGSYNPAGEWRVEAVAELSPPNLDEGSHSLKTGSLAEEYNIDQSTENRGNDYKDNNIAMRPGNEVTIDVNNTAGIKVVGDFVYEAGQGFDKGAAQDGVIHITPSSGDDSFYGELSVSIPSGHGDLYWNGEKLEPGEEYDVTLKDKDGNDVSGKLTVTDEGGRLSVTFTPDNPADDYKGLDLEVRLNGDDYSDKDIQVSVEGNLVNDKSGQHSSGVNGKGEVLVDAVAQKPVTDESQAPEHDAIAPGSDAGVTVTIAATFDDVDDGSENHFLLIEVKPGHSYTFTILVDGVEQTHTLDVTSEWPTVQGPDGTLYYKIPVSTDENGNPVYDENGKASVDVEIKVTAPYFGGATSDIKYGSMAEDSAQDGEKTYDNNIAFSDEGSLSIGVDLDSGGGHPVQVDVAYENNTPHANTGDSSESYAKITLPDDAADIKLNPGEGSILYWDGSEYVELTAGQDGWVSISPDQAGNIYYKVPENYDDKDLSLGYAIDGATGNTPVYVDAVAQQGSVDSASAQREIDSSTGKPYAAVGEGEVTITVSLSGLVDQDGSSDYYVLVEAKPGWECLEDGAEMVLVDGKAYYRVPVDADSINADGTVNVEVRMQTPDAGADGTVRETLGVGSMVVDRPTDTGELTMDNNVAVNVNGSVDIYKSVAQPNLVLDVGTGYEDQLGEPAPISVSGVGDNDEVTELHFSVESGKGQFVYDGEVLEDGEYDDLEGITITVKTEDGVTTVSVTAKAPATGLSEQDLKDYLNDKLGLQPADGNTSSEDLEMDWGYTVRDTESGDTATKGDATETVVVDAVAHKPEVSEYEVDYNGREAALPGDSVTVNAKVEFSDLTAESNYVLVQFLPGWEVEGVTLTVNGVSIYYSADEIKNMELFYPNGSAGGGTYYKVPLDDGDTNLAPGANSGERYEVEVSVDVKVPEKGNSGDSQTNLGIGGAAVDSYGDGETILSNNVDSDAKSGEGIAIGIVDSTGLEAGQKGDAPEEGADNVIGINIEAVGGENDVITGLTLTSSDPEAGSFYYDGRELEYDLDGTVTLPPSWLSEEDRKNWQFDSDKLEFRPDATYGGQVNVKVEGTVSDARSGASKDGFETDMTIEVTPVATQPTGLEATSGFDQDGGLWTLTLSAVFADYDGSEEHFFLIRIPEGLTLQGEYTLTPVTGPDGSDGWYRIDVSGTEHKPSLDLSFTADSSYDGTSGVEYQAGASENNTTVWADAPNGDNAASPADDGGFAFRTEVAEGQTDFSHVEENLFIMGSGLDDTIIGGLGDDTILGGEGNDVIYATQGDNLIIGGVGNDTLYGGNGEDTFFWDVSHFGTDETAHDVVYNFEYGKDILSFNDVFGDDMDLSSVDGILSSLQNGKGDFADNSLSLNGESSSLKAEFTDSGVVLNITSGDSSQTIEVNFGGQGGAVYEMPSSVDEAAEALRNLLSQGMF